MNSSEIDSLIFDLDGTLWDATDSYIAAWNAAILKFGLPRTISRSDLESRMGLEAKIVYEHIFPAQTSTEQKQIARLVSQMQDKLLPEMGGKLYPGVKEGLMALSRQYKLFIVSNCPENTVADFINWTGIKSIICDYETHGRTHKSKADNIRLIMERNNLQNPVYIGDTFSDLKASKAAGIPFCYVSYGFEQNVESELTFSSFADLTAYFLNSGN